MLDSGRHEQVAKPFSMPGSSGRPEVSTAPRFLTLADVAEILNTSVAQVKALVQRRELKALQLGGRQQWRIEASELESFIERMYVRAEQNLDRKGRAPTADGEDAPTSSPS